MRDIEGFIKRMNPSFEKKLSRNEKPDDILDGVDMKYHKSVLNAVKENGICLWTNVEEKPKDGDKELKKRTVFRKILEDTFNGNKIVEEVLDSYIKKTAENENDADYGIEIDFSGLTSDDSRKQTTCINELLQLWAKANRSKADIYSGNLNLLFILLEFSVFRSLEASPSCLPNHLEMGKSAENILHEAFDVYGLCYFLFSISVLSTCANPRSAKSRRGITIPGKQICPDDRKYQS